MEKSGQFVLIMIILMILNGYSSAGAFAALGVPTDLRAFRVALVLLVWPLRLGAPVSVEPANLPIRATVRQQALQPRAQWP